MSKIYFFEEINKIDKPLTRFIKKKGQRTQINKIRNERGQITADTRDKQRIGPGCMKDCSDPVD